MDLSELGETGLIARMRDRVPCSVPGLRVGIGDDTAVFDWDERHFGLLTCDMMVENKHFRLEEFSPGDLGYKIVAVNVSDIAGMGGEPLYAVLSGSLPGSLQVEFADELTNGVLDACKAFGCALVGGDTCAGEHVVLDLALVGKVLRTNLKLRSGGRPGDLIAVTGTLGESAAGVILLAKKDPGMGKYPEFVARQRRPQARLAEGQLLGGFDGIHALTDVSDGLAKEVTNICTESGCGAVIDASEIPVSGALAEFCRDQGLDPVEMALGGGEDYELVCVVKPDVIDKLQNQFASNGLAPLTVCGQLTAEDEGIMLAGTGAEPVPLSVSGFDHFSAKGD